MDPARQEQTPFLAGLGEPVDSFLSGYLSNVDYVNRDCWVNTCKTHSPQSF